MAATGFYELGDGKSLPTNCFPIRSYFQPSKEGAGNWLVAQRADLQCRFNAVLCSKLRDHGKTNTGLQSKILHPWHTHQDASLKSEIKENVLDRFYLMNVHCVENPSDLCSVDISDRNLVSADDDGFQAFDNVAYINAAGNLLALDTFRKFPSLRELELSLNALRNLKVNHEDFVKLQVLDLSYNNLSPDDIFSLGLLPQIRVLHLTGNGLHTLPPDITESFISVKAHGMLHVPRFQTLEILMLDDNKLSHPNVFASLASVKRLKHLNLDKNGIREVPYLQQAMESGYLLSPDSNKMSHIEELQHRNPTTEEINVNSSFSPSYQKFTSVVGDVAPHAKHESADGMKKASPEFSLPFPELRYLSLADNKITEEEDLLAVALFPSLNELIIYGNPLTTYRSGDSSLLNSFLQQKLGINITREKMTHRKKTHIFVPLNPKRKVKSHIPKVPKQPLMLEYSPKSFLLGQHFDPGETGITTDKEPQRSSLSEPLPQIGYSSVAGQGREPEEAVQDSDSLMDERPGKQSPTNITSEVEQEDTEAFFMTQVDDLPDLVWKPEDNINMEETKKKQEEVKKDTIPDKYKGYEELLDAKPDPDFIEPVGIQQNVQALDYALKHLLIYRAPKAKLESLQKPYVPKQKKVRKLPDLPPQRNKTEELETILTTMKDRKTTTELPLGTVLRNKKSNRKEYEEALDLLKKLQKKYKKVYTDTVNHAAQIEAQYQETITGIKEAQSHLGGKGNMGGKMNTQ